MILAIDPGPERSGWVLYCDNEIRAAGIDDNMSAICKASAWDTVVCEWVECYGMPVGHDVFESVQWIGRFAQFLDREYGLPLHRVTRREVKLYLCNRARAKDKNIRAALIDRFGGSKAKAIGTKKKAGTLYNVKGHAWAALAVAVTWAGRGQ